MNAQVTVGPFAVGARGPLQSSPIVAPTQRMLNLTKQALLALDDDVDPLSMIPAGRVGLLFGWVDYIPGTHDRAAGYTVGGPTLLVRWGLSDAQALSPTSVQGTILHEAFGHGRLALKPLTDAQMTRALKLLTVGPPLPTFTNPHDVWKEAPGDAKVATDLKIDPYWLRPFECIINDLVKALTGAAPLVVSWDHKYARHVADADLPKLKALWLEGLAATVPAPPATTPTPVPVQSEPPPATPDLQALLDAANAQNAQLLAAMQALQQERTDQDGRLASKDASLRTAQASAQAAVAAAAQGLAK